MRTWEEIETANKSCANEANHGEAGIGRRPPPHDEVQKPGGSSIPASPADAPRYPLASLRGGEAPYGAGAASRGSNTSLRPYVVPYTDRSTPAVKPDASAGKQQGSDDHGVTLRCMYTNQKTKKRKVWSDGAVKCCPKRQRVCLYRWSEVLGITDKLLGEIYLSAPEYEAFLTEGEPELEMELYIVSLDGVIQNEPPSGSDQADAGGAEKSAGANNGRKRKLLKPFKPPTRRAPSFPPAAATASAASAPMYDPRGPPGRMNEGQNGGQFSLGREGARGDGRGALTARSSYTGFGHVEGLWDDEQECEDAGVGLARDNAGWGIGAGGGRSAHGDRDRGRNAFVDARSEEAQTVRSSAETAAAGGSSSGSGVLRGQGDRGEERDSSRFSHDSRLGETFGDYAEGGRSRDGGRTHAFEDRGHAAPYDESFENEGGGARMPMPTTSSSSWGEYEVVGARDGRRFATEYGDGSREDDRRGGGPFGAGTLPDNRGVVQRTHESIPEPRGDEGQVRSTQDILSLFGGGFGENPFGDQNADNPPWEREEMPVAPLRSRGSNEMSPAHAREKRDEETLLDLEVASIPGGFVLPAAGKGRAADMRRAQNAARAVEPPASTGLEGGAAARVAAAPAVDDGAPPDWACDVCGVRGSPSSTSCRVCGAKRRPRRNDAGGGGSGGGGGGGGGVGGVGGGGGGDGGGDATLGDERGDAAILGCGQRGGSNGSKGTGWGGDAGDEGTGETGVSASGWVGSDDMPRGREIDHTVGSNVEGATCRGEGVGELGRNPSGCPSFSSAGEEGLGNTGGSGGESGTPRKRQIAGVRMQMDFGSSSDSDNG